MAKSVESLDIANSADLRALVERVRRSNSPCLLRDGDLEAALIVPVAHTNETTMRLHSEEDYNAFLSSAGGWQGIVDTDRLLEDSVVSRSPAPNIRRN